jgi:cytochrome c biogenesis protein CcmG/thiol:disulfide interchange protein DsbE
MTDQAPTPSAKSPASLEDPDGMRQAPSPDAGGTQGWMRGALALVVAFAIVGSAWLVGERQGWTEIGRGGINATLLPEVGKPAPELFTMSSTGEPVLLSQLRGEPVWINFWGSWCPPCRAEMPDVQKAYSRLAPQGLHVLSIAMQESPEDAVRYRDSAGATFPVYIDPTRIASMIDSTEQPALAQQLALMTKDWQIANFPTHVFIDENGIIQSIVLSQMTYEEAVEHGEAVLKTAQRLMPPAIVRQSTRADIRSSR